MFFLPPDEETPEIERWEIQNCFGRSLGTVPVLDPKAGPTPSDLRTIPEVDATLGIVWLIYNNTTREYRTSTGEVVYKLIPPSKKPKKDYCAKCFKNGVFIKTALVCPKCNALLGGF